MKTLPNIHPGEVLLEEFLTPLGISQNALARAAGVPPRRINQIVLGKRGEAEEHGEMVTPVSGPPRILRDSFSRNLAWVLLLISLCTPDAKGACLDWSRSVGRPDHSAVYTGMLGEHPVRMMLHLDVATGYFDGAYGYNDQPAMLILTGDMLPEGVGAELDERDPRGHLTGHFTLRFFRPRLGGEDLATYDKEDRNTCDYLTGSWRSLSGNKTRKVALFPDGEIDPVYDEEREMNEVTAYKLRRAMLDSNRKSFASLLRYPFTKNRGRWVVGVWNNPEEVVRNYKKIIPFSKKQIVDAVPHILQTSQKNGVRFTYKRLKCRNCCAVVDGLGGFR